TISKAVRSMPITIHDSPDTPISSAAWGSLVHDSAPTRRSSDLFDPTGNVSFTFFTSGDCSTGGSDAGTVALAAGVAHPSSSEGPLAAGSYSIHATCPSDSNFTGSTGPSEPLTTTKAGSLLAGPV